MQTVTTTPGKRLGDAKEVARLLDCSWRHVLRMADAGLLPWGCKLGTLRRWDLDEISKWISEGCKPVRSHKGRD
ncbi:helix-turn-helix transcriptional regulator [Telmatocola sphagniphila]|uniref:helix-turn-helix transcriptional regulator n=1 Tax=Telmatocola sphagniphila TaxID=1123043 RepID=UPI0036F31D33